MGSIKISPTEVVALTPNYQVEGSTVFELNERGYNRLDAHVTGYRNGADEAECIRVAKLFSAAPDLLAAAKLAEAFVEEELAIRKRSYLPSPNVEDAGCIGCAEAVLVTVRAAITKSEGK